MVVEEVKNVYVIVFYSNKSKDYLRVDGIVAKKPKPLKVKCCEKYKKGKRCKRCPCFDLI
ncbi:hypothetical protein GFO_0128 [Christiangramia forsetii KT0803]|uniref:Uncharacterized protein n=2 Tax=Christiangramia forsetii TaxID=411153 RepID=A0LXM2_CHRFK|nr:hypothetical protein GCM10011532_20160 [Christiangramia forsetii]CAL65117.1 hypothetical protein GFO_0128 [Christiangramia forsetii KT0803]